MVFGDDIAEYQKMVANLRNANIRAELYLGNPKHSLGQQMKYADRRNSPCAIVQGSDEKARSKVQIKDLISGAGLTDIKDREEYLKRQAEAQVEVDQDKLVAEVKKILARHDVWSRSPSSPCERGWFRALARNRERGSGMHPSPGLNFASLNSRHPLPQGERGEDRNCGKKGENPRCLRSP